MFAEDRNFGEVRPAVKLILPVRKFFCLNPDCRQRIFCERTPGLVRALGVDDFAFRKGQSYWTILVDQERRRVVDLLPDREAATLANWLEGHSGIEIVTLDRAS